MIVEMVTCDQCDHTDVMKGSVVPDEWVTVSGKHYCTTDCALTAWQGAA